ncbi:hypothetical protein LCGC14_1334710 [marine sediment metagenome]|uniref:Uncharacterized protein n=1 Tax=marine sediment metagenome TaxID=412755 RepID=A0A0F9KG93_9ZZZZ
MLNRRKLLKGAGMVAALSVVSPRELIALQDVGIGQTDKDGTRPKIIHCGTKGSSDEITIVGLDVALPISLLCTGHISRSDMASSFYTDRSLEAALEMLETKYSPEKSAPEIKKAFLKAWGDIPKDLKPVRESETSKTKPGRIAG